MKFIRLDMTQRTIRVEQVPSIYVGLGGRGLISVMLNEEMQPSCNPLGPDNKLIFAPGLLGGPAWSIPAVLPSAPRAR